MLKIQNVTSLCSSCKNPAFPQINHISMSEASKRGKLFNSTVFDSWVTFPQHYLQVQVESPCLFTHDPKELSPHSCAGAVNPFNPLLTCCFFPFIISPSLLWGRRHFQSCPSHRSDPSPAGTSGSHPLTPISIISPSVHKHSPYRHHLSSEPHGLLSKNSIHWENGQHKAGVRWSGMIQKKGGRDGPPPS